LLVLGFISLRLFASLMRYHPYMLTFSFLMLAVEVYLICSQGRYFPLTLAGVLEFDFG
jgi:hypothetical protein